MNSKKAIILLSGGLDSVVSLAILRNEYDFKLALTFDYGQKAFLKENYSAKMIAEHYNIEHKVIKLDWLKEITSTNLVSEKKVPTVDIDKLNDETITKNSMKNVWVPNRNGVFLNIAAAYADSFDYNYIVIGANKEEATTFSDNSLTFIQSLNKTLETSTNVELKVIAPLINYNKDEIVKQAIEQNIPFEYLNSCYNNTKKHCGNCESCNRLKRALINNNREDIIKQIFEKEEG